MNGFGKTISLFLIEGDPNKRWVCELSNWNGKAYKLPRIEVKKCFDRPDLTACGVYFLFGKRDADGKGIAYIGEAENVFDRLKQHDTEKKGKDFWNECVVFISKDNRLNKAHIKYLEHRCYLLAKQADRYILENASIPADASLTEPEQAEMEEFLYNIRLLINALGHKILEPVIESDSKNPEDKSEQYRYIQAAKGADATGIQTSEGFVVLKGSKAALSTVPSCPKWVCVLRDQLKAEGVINDNWVFTEDRVFSSLSSAAGVIMGRSANGHTEWRPKEK